MSEENQIYIKFENAEAVLSKQDVLFSEMALLKIAQKIKGYNFYRLKEFELKLILYKKIKGLQMSFGGLQKSLPKPRIPDILKKFFKEEEEYKATKVKSIDRSIEEQLQEIEKRLNELQSRSI